MHLGQMIEELLQIQCRLWKKVANRYLRSGTPVTGMVLTNTRTGCLGGHIVLGQLTYFVFLGLRMCCLNMSLSALSFETNYIDCTPVNSHLGINPNTHCISILTSSGALFCSSLPLCTPATVYCLGLDWTWASCCCCC